MSEYNFFWSHAKRCWLESITPFINVTSLGASLSFQTCLDEPWCNPTAETINQHEGRHPLLNPRYKEWWYWDGHGSDGFVISVAIVLSIVKPHVLLWIHHPALIDNEKKQIPPELMMDCQVQVNEWGTEGINLTAPNLHIFGESDSGYTLKFKGIRHAGMLRFNDPMPGRIDQHNGFANTVYCLYQITGMRLRGEITDRRSNRVIAINGSGYHDHWWGIMNRHTKWEWIQFRGTNSWVGSFYRGRYGRGQNDLHCYGWLYIPGIGLLNISDTEFEFRQSDNHNQWILTTDAPEGILALTVNARIEHYQHKEIEFLGVPLGEVHYFQYPITAEGSFTNRDGNIIPIRVTEGMLEWDWDAVW